jgi:hypothetical protein
MIKELELGFFCQIILFSYKFKKLFYKIPHMKVIKRSDYHAVKHVFKCDRSIGYFFLISDIPSRKEG